MIDDYRYISTPLSPKNDGPFGLAGNPSVGTNGFSNSINDSQPRTQNISSGSGSGSGSGTQIVNNYYTSGLPDAVDGDMLYYNGATNAWVTLNKPASDGVLSIVGSNPTWITSNRNGSLIYYDSNLNSWLTIPAPTGTATYVLGYRNEVLEWIQTVDCGATGP
jgi:hypothetical protein